MSELRVTQIDHVSVIITGARVYRHVPMKS
jgi:hypothetical protein